MKNQKAFRVIAIILIAIALFAFLFSTIPIKCNSVSPTNNDSSSHSNPPEANVPSFNEDTAYTYIEKQVSFGPRIPGTKAQTECAAWLQALLQHYTTTVIVQETEVTLYNNMQVPCKNIIASFHPEKKKRILLLTHWDTRPWSDQDSTEKNKSFDGADDGGSGTAVLLEVARQLSVQPTGVGIDLLFVDVEDYGPPASDEKNYTLDETDITRFYCLGTQYWADHPHVPNYRAYYGILLDMVGAKNAVFYKEGFSMQFAPSVVNHIWNFGNVLGYGSYFLNENGNPVTDDHIFVNSMNGTPTIDIIHLSKTSGKGFGSHWHTQEDNLSVIDPATLKAVGQTVLQVIYSEPNDAL